MPDGRVAALSRDGLVLSPETVSAIGAAEARRNRWTALALSVIAILLAFVAYLLLRGTPEGAMQ